LGEPPFLAVKLIHLPDEPAGVVTLEVSGFGFQCSGRMPTVRPET
jgi:hypothetical protein